MADNKHKGESQKETRRKRFLDEINSYFSLFLKRKNQQTPTIQSKQKEKKAILTYQTNKQLNKPNSHTLPIKFPPQS